jgi:glycosyltransferase involved in cell wall biosynthesis
VQNVNRLRVLSVINALHFGGDESRLLSLSKTIDRAQFEHIVMTLKKPHPDLEAQSGSCRPYFAEAGIEVIDLGDESPRLGATGSISNVARAVPRLTRVLFRLARFVRERGIDVIDGHLSTGNRIGAAVSVLTHVPAVLTTYQLEQFEPAWLCESSERACFSAAYAIVTDSDPVAERVRRKLLRPRPVAVIPNGIEPPPSSRTTEEMRLEFGIPVDADVRVVGQISSLSPRKGHAILLDAAARVIESAANVWFVCCGYERVDGYADFLRARARELGVAERVRFVSYPGAIGDVYRAIDIQVHASTGESLPNAIIEGMSLGKPAVVTAVAGIPAMVSDGRTGLVAPPGDSEALAQALLRLLREPQFAQVLGKAARERYATRYTETHMTRELQEVFMQAACRV